MYYLKKRVIHAHALPITSPKWHSSAWDELRWRHSVAQPPLIPSNAAVSNKSSTLGSSAALKLRWMVHV